MTRPIVIEVNISTQEQITREMNDVEFAAYQAAETERTNTIAAQEEADAAAQSKKDAAAAVLAKLGITQEVLDLLAK